MIESAELLPKVKHRKKQDDDRANYNTQGNEAGKGSSLKMEKNRDINAYDEKEARRREEEAHLKDMVERASNEYGSAGDKKNLFDESLNTTNDLGSSSMKQLNKSGGQHATLPKGGVRSEIHLQNQMERDQNQNSQNKEAASSKDGKDKKPRHVSSPYSFPSFEETKKRLSDHKGPEELNAKTPILEDGHETPGGLPADRSEEYDADQDMVNRSLGQESK